MSSVPLPFQRRSPLKIVVWAVPITALLVVLPRVITPYQTILLTYGLAMAIAAWACTLAMDAAL